MRVAIVGATGVVGETMLRVLEERRLPIAELGAFASRSRSGALRFRERALDVQQTSAEALGRFDAVFFASGEDASAQYVPRLLERRCVVIDNSAVFRMDAAVPLIVPEVNGDQVRAEHRLFPIANCTAILLAMALAPIHALAGLRSVVLSTYQAASGAGRAGLDELAAGEQALALGVPEPQANIFAAPLARNVVPLIGALDADGWSSEERKVCEETRKLFAQPDLDIVATTVRVPVRTAHAESILVQTQRPVALEALRAAYALAPGMVFHRDGIITPREVQGHDEVHVARLRRVAPSEDRVALFAVGDQLRKGAATNAVQILELLLAKGFIHA